MLNYFYSLSEGIVVGKVVSVMSQQYRARVTDFSMFDSPLEPIAHDSYFGYLQTRKVQTHLRGLKHFIDQLTLKKFAYAGQPVGAVAFDTANGVGGVGSIASPVKSDAVSQTALYRCCVFLELCCHVLSRGGSPRHSLRASA